MNIPTLNFPTWKQIQSLDLENEDSFHFIVFGAEHFNIEGYISIESEYNRHNNKTAYYIVFDVLIDESSHNYYTAIEDFTEKGYKNICEHALYVYKQIITDLLQNTVADWKEWIDEYCTNS